MYIVGAFNISIGTCRLVDHVTYLIKHIHTFTHKHTHTHTHTHTHNNNNIYIYF